jgi:hypothetical protein
MSDRFTDHREAAQAILRRVLGGTGSLRSKEGQFIGGLSFDANEPTEKQLQWLGILLEKHGLPPLELEGAK